MTRKPVLVTLADKKYLKYAKQVFAGAYFNAGWKGDFLLLAHNCRDIDLQWFRKKGIYTKKCKTIIKGRKNEEASIIQYSKLYLFTEDMKKWSHVVFLDADTLVRASLDNLLKARYISAVPNIDLKLGAFFKKKSMLVSYNPNERTFCSGILAFNTGIIQKNTFKRLLNIVVRYERLIDEDTINDEPFLNLFFYGKWQKLARVFNCYNDKNQDLWHLSFKDLRGIVIHAASQADPWQKISDLHGEWAVNYRKAEKIFLDLPKNVKRWPKSKIFIYSFYLSCRLFFFRRVDYGFWRFNENYFKLLNYFEQHFPSAFHFLKRTKARIKGIKINEKGTSRNASR